jgi:lipoprotein signal peptidase
MVCHSDAANRTFDFLMRKLVDAYKSGLVELTSLTFLVVLANQAANGLVRLINPSTYTHNQHVDFFWWLLLIEVCIGAAIPFRPIRICVALTVGGGLSNIADYYVWPGGIPDYIRVAWIDGTWNVADACIWVGAIGLGLIILTWGVCAFARWVIGHHQFDERSTS